MGKAVLQNVENLKFAGLTARESDIITNCDYMKFDGSKQRRLRQIFGNQDTFKIFPRSTPQTTLNEVIIHSLYGQVADVSGTIVKYQ